MNYLCGFENMRKHTNYGSIQPKYSTFHSEKGMVAMPKNIVMGLHA